MACPALSDWASVRLPWRHGPPAGQISPDKDVNFPCATAAFTLSPAPGGLRHLVLTRPGTEPSMRFLSVGSHLCARASSRQPLARLPLPSASSFICPHGHTGTPTGDFHPTSSRPCRAYASGSSRFQVVKPPAALPPLAAYPPRQATGAILLALQDRRSRRRAQRAAAPAWDEERSSRRCRPPIIACDLMLFWGHRS